MNIGYTPEAAQKRIHGFTALELSVVLIIISLMVGTTLILGNVRVEQEKVESTKNRIALVERALVAYAEINRRLPCPSYPTYKNGDAKFGIESDSPGTCNNGTPDTTWFTSDSAIGSVPTTTLGLPHDAMYDAWGRRLTYAVHTVMTAENAFRRNSLDSSCGGLKIANDAGAIAVPNAMYVVLSHGADGHGAFNAEGTRLNARITNSATLDNANTNAAFVVNGTTKDNIYRSQGYFEDTTNAANRYDDIVSYRTRKTFVLPSDSRMKNFSVSNNQSAAGWLYVPEYTLPSGKVVPAFEVMKYLASDDGNGLPLSKPLVAPWTNQSFENARMACQRLGGYASTSALTGVGNQLEYDIIGETQWLSIAHQLAEDSRNWVDGCFNPTSGGMIGGHRDNSPPNVIVPSDNDNSGYHLTGNSDDATAATGNSVYKRSQRRTFYLPSGGVLWDFSGNASQWSYCDMNYAAGENQYYRAARTDAGQPDNGYSMCQPDGRTSLNTYFGGTATMDAGEHWYNTAACILPTTRFGEFFDINPRNGLVSTNGSTTDHNVGIINSSSETAVNGITRGANYQSALAGGVFNIYFGNPSMARQGFRCVKNIQPKIVSPDNFAGLEVWYDASDLDGDGVAEGTGELGLQTPGVCTKNASYGKNNGCVLVWRNKAQNKYHARSVRQSGAASGSSDNMPTYKSSGINGMPSVNFNGASGRAEWLDTWHGINDDPATDDGLGLDFGTMTQFTLFAVVMGPQPHNIITAGPTNPDAALTGGSFSFPYNDQPDGSPPRYFFITSKNYAGADATKSNCPYTITGDSPTCPGGVRTNAACALMNASTGGPGMNSSPHVISAIFNPNAGDNQGMIALVDSAAQHQTDSAVQVATGALRPAAISCGGVNVTTRLLLGQQRGSNTRNFTGDVAEILIYNRALSAGDRLKIELYLSDKYNIALTTVK